MGRCRGHVGEDIGWDMGKEVNRIPMTKSSAKSKDRRKAEKRAGCVNVGRMVHCKIMGKIYKPQCVDCGWVKGKDFDREKCKKENRT